MRLQGQKGGGGGFKQTPDNLRSEDTFEGVLGLCIGPIKGPTRGLKSVKIDGTPVENETGELNFKDFIITTADGDPAAHPQRPALKLGAGASPMSVSVSLTNPNTAAGQGSPGPWVTRTLSNTGASFIDLRFILNQLYRQDKNGIYGETLNLEIQMKPVGKTTWVNPMGTTPSGSYSEQGQLVEDYDGEMRRAYIPRSYYNGAGTAWNTTSSYYPITGKTTSPSVYELRISVPNTGNYASTAWDVRVRLLERGAYDNGSTTDNVQEKRSISWESMAAVYGETMGGDENWRGLAWLQLYGKASDQLTGVPDIMGEYDTKIVKVPASAIYNPTTRQYTAGVWDGSWAYAYTNDPAWVINDAISDSLSGLALMATGSYLNKWDALEASKWFSELVSDGDGGTHPRYSMNLAIGEPQKAEELIRYLAGACGALAWDDGNGQWRMKVDKPENAVDLFTTDNIEGEFQYSHTDVDTRFNDIIGKFKNAEMDYREDAVHLYDNASIALIGRKPTTIALVGCTNRQEAMRRVKLRLCSAVNEKRMVSFVTNRRGRNVEPLDTILIADNDLGDKRTTGRIVSIAGDRLSFTVRDDMRLETGVSYTLKFAKPNTAYAPEPSTQPTSADWKKPTTVLSRNVTNTSGQRGWVKTIYVGTALPADIADYLTVALEATGLTTLPKQYRVLDVGYEEDGERVGISAIEIDTGKWAAADGVVKDDAVFTDLRGAVSPPTVVGANPLLSLVSVPSAQGVNVNLMASWARPAGSNISGFRVRYRVNGGNWQIGTERTQFNDFELVNPPPGVYEFEICTISRVDEYSAPLKGSLEVTLTLLTAALIRYSDGTPINNLQPAEPGATLGARAGVNLLANGGTVLGDSAIRNLYVTIGSNGTLSGAGGGQVTIGGLGFTGDLSASSGDNLILNGSMGQTSTNLWWGTATRTAGVAASNEPAFYARATGAGGAGGGINGGISLPVTPGEDLFFSGLIRDQTAASNNSWSFTVLFLKADGSNLTQLITYLPANSTSFILRKDKMTVPAGAATALISIFGYANTGSWIDMAFPRVARTELAATTGAVWTTNLVGRPSNLAALAGTEGINNTLVSVAANGALSGGGGGQVTLPGLGGDAGATQADNRIRNTTMAVTTTDTWWGPLTRTTGVAANNDPAFFARTTTGVGDGGYINNGVRAPCVAGERMYCSALGRSQTVAGNNQIRFNPFFYKADGSFLSQQIKVFSPQSTSFGAGKTYFDVPVGAATFECLISVLNNTGSYTDVAMPRIGFTEYLADVTISIELASEKTIAADYQGAINADLLAIQTWSPRVQKAGVSIKTTASVDYVLTDVYGVTGGTGFVIDNTAGSASKGDVTIASGTTLALISGGNISMTIDGLAMPKIPFKLTKTLAEAPATTGGGGGTPGKAATWDSGEMVGLNTTTYTTIFNSVKTVALASGETLYGSAPLDYYVGGATSANRTMTMKWQYSVAGANSWNDFAAGITGSLAYSGRNTGGTEPEWMDPIPGSVAVTQSKSGLAAGNYDVRIVAVCSATGRVCTPSGSATMEAKV